MRDAINNNPMVQLAVIGGLLLVAALIFLMGPMKGKEEESASSDTSTTSASLTTPQGTVDLNVEVTPTPGAAAVPPPAASTGVVTPEALIPGPGLPAEFASAWKGGDTVVLLIVRGGGVDDRLVRSSVAALSGRAGISVFVARAKDVARYSRITQPVGVNRAPALVVVRPKRLSGETPEALVSYGFRDSQGVVQAVDDALYSGKDNGPYHPG